MYLFDASEEFQMKDFIPCDNCLDLNTVVSVVSHTYTGCTVERETGNMSM